MIYYSSLKIQTGITNIKKYIERRDKREMEQKEQKKRKNREKERKKEKEKNIKRKEKRKKKKLALHLVSNKESETIYCINAQFYLF